MVVGVEATAPDRLLMLVMVVMVETAVMVEVAAPRLRRQGSVC
jgi:hypothetical protein